MCSACPLFFELLFLYEVAQVIALIITIRGVTCKWAQIQRGLAQSLAVQTTTAIFSKYQCWCLDVVYPLSLPVCCFKFFMSSNKQMRLHYKTKETFKKLACLRIGRTAAKALELNVHGAGQWKTPLPLQWGYVKKVMTSAHGVKNPSNLGSEKLKLESSGLSLTVVCPNFVSLVSSGHSIILLCPVQKQKTAPTSQSLTVFPI